LQVSGHFLQLVDFLQGFSAGTLPIICQNFSIKIDRTQVGMNQISLQMLGMYIPTVLKITAPSHWQKILLNKMQDYRDPFVEEGRAMLTDRMEDYGLMLQAVKLQQIKWVGYLHEGNDFWALAQLPNGRVVSVLKAMEIGIEKGKVLKIAEENILLQVNKQKIRLNYSIFS